MGFQALLRDLKWPARLRIFTDATTGKALASRRGFGRVRHIEVSDLWVQEKVRNGVFEINKIKNAFNTADLLTKHLGNFDVMKCVEAFGCFFAQSPPSVKRRKRKFAR